MDVLLAWAKSHDWRSHNWGPLTKVVDWFVDPQDEQAGFWDNAVLLVGLEVRKKTDPEDLEADLEAGLEAGLEAVLEVGQEEDIEEDPEGHGSVLLKRLK